VLFEPFAPLVRSLSDKGLHGLRSLPSLSAQRTRFYPQCPKFSSQSFLTGNVDKTLYVTTEPRLAIDRRCRKSPAQLRGWLLEPFGFGRCQIIRSFQSAYHKDLSLCAVYLAIFKSEPESVLS
jgi:hypothetical protein